MPAATASRQTSLRIAMTACHCCGRRTRNPKFCSRTCAAKVNNVLVPKRSLGGKCNVCGSRIQTRYTYCHLHRPTPPWDRSQPISTVKKDCKHPAYRFAVLRADARRQYLRSAPYRCVRCGYDKHIHVCHKRPLASYPLDTPISVVNSLDNLAGLCPNCHWEFDHGLLQL
jgi:hypothetical protein